MSHFTVLVIGNDPETQLEPFSENLRVPAYVQGDVSDEDKKRFLDHYQKEEGVSPDLTFDEVYSIHGEDWNDNTWRKNEQGVWQEYSTYNPNSKWDWYSLGGRWMGFFKLKEGAVGELGRSGTFGNKPDGIGMVDAARKCDIDFDAIRNKAGQEAAEYYDRFWKLVGDQPLPNWKEIRERHGEGNIDAARKEYGNHPVTQILKTDEDFRFAFINEDIMRMAETRGDYIENERRSSIVTFAVLHNGKWFEKGNMGWWGMVSDEKDQNEWNNQFYELLESLPNDTLLSVYDCHI